jgi:hypothetical protein
MQIKTVNAEGGMKAVNPLVHKLMESASKHLASLAWKDPTNARAGQMIVHYEEHPMSDVVEGKSLRP